MGPAGRLVLVQYLYIHDTTISVCLLSSLLLTLHCLFSSCSLAFLKMTNFLCLWCQNTFTVTALLDCTNDWYANLDRKMFNLAVLIDLKKALDTVGHRTVWNKRTGSNFTNILSYKSNSEMPNIKPLRLSN